MHKNQFINIANRLLVLLTALFLNYCSSTNIVKTEVPVYEYPSDWKNLTIRSQTISEYSIYLSGRKIFLDPGHGGEDRKNKNKTGDVVEADVNLRVALYLKKYLEESGAFVIPPFRNSLIYFTTATLSRFLSFPSTLTRAIYIPGATVWQSQTNSLAPITPPRESPHTRSPEKL